MTVAHDIGDKRRFNATFKDPAGVLTDPTTVTSEVRDPAGTVTTPSPVTDGTGLWHLDVSFNLAGRWVIKIIGAGVVEATEEIEVWIRKGGTT